MKKPVEFVRAQVGLKNGKPFIRFQRPSLNAFEERWVKAVSNKAIQIYFESNCPLTVCADPVTGHTKFGQSCDKKCFESNLNIINSVKKRIADKITRPRRRKSTS